MHAESAIKPAGQTKTRRTIRHAGFLPYAVLRL